jgi:chromosome segregation ATPase
MIETSPYYDEILAAVEELKSMGKPASVRAVRTIIGHGSMSTIHPIVKAILSASPTLPVDTEEKFRPLLEAAAVVTKKVVLEATSLLKVEIERLESDGEEAATTITSLEEDLKKKMAEIEQLKSEKSNLTAMVSLREKDFQEAKVEAAIAREKAAKLEGQLEELLKVRGQHEVKPSSKKGKK